MQVCLVCPVKIDNSPSMNLSGVVITRGKPPGIWALTLTLTLQNPYPPAGVRVLEGFEGVFEGFRGFKGFEGFLYP